MATITNPWTDSRLDGSTDPVSKVDDELNRLSQDTRERLQNGGHYIPSSDDQKSGVHCVSSAAYDANEWNVYNSTRATKLLTVTNSKVETSVELRVPKLYVNGTEIDPTSDDDKRFQMTWIGEGEGASTEQTSYIRALEQYRPHLLRDAKLITLVVRSTQNCAWYFGTSDTVEVHVYDIDEQYHNVTGTDNDMIEALCYNDATYSTQVLSYTFSNPDTYQRVGVRIRDINYTFSAGHSISVKFNNSGTDPQSYIVTAEFVYV